MGSPSTTFSTSAVVATGSAETVDGEAYATAANAAMATAATRMWIVFARRRIRPQACRKTRLTPAPRREAC
jgi:hypothetical protein